MPHGGKLMPNLDEKTTKVLNLTVLQRIDPFVKEILITASHVTFYGFDVDNCQWSRKDVEGSFFVVKRSSQPRFQFIVMNRRNTENLVENLLGDFEYDVQVPYLLYRNASQVVNGIWFYNAQECEEVADLFSRILNAYSKVPTKSKITSTKSEFEELEAAPTMAVMDGPLEPISSSTTANVSDIVDDPAFVNFFSTALNVGGAPNAAISGQPYHSITAISTLHPESFALPTLASTQIPSNVSLSTPVTTALYATEPLNRSKQLTELVKPSFFGTIPSTSPLVVPPISSSIPTAPPLNSTGNLHRPYGAALLQPFPPPTPSPSLTPTSGLTTTDYGPAIRREKLREALQMLVQDDQFIDMVYRAVLSAHQMRYPWM